MLQSYHKLWDAREGLCQSIEEEDESKFGHANYITW